MGRGDKCIKSLVVSVKTNGHVGDIITNWKVLKLFVME
jgi:hypothetical protein